MAQNSSSATGTSRTRTMRRNRPLMLIITESFTIGDYIRATYQGLKLFNGQQIMRISVKTI